MTRSFQDISTPAPYIGGKRGLAKVIIPLLQQISHSAYVEPFVGMGGIFLRKPKNAALEVINDINGDIYTLFRVIREHPDFLAQIMATRPACRQEHERLARARPDTLTDLQRAARFLYLQRLAYSGHIERTHFSKASGDRLRVQHLPKLFKAITTRMQGVTVENQDWKKCLRTYDSKKTLFYLDPPYDGFEDFYGPNLFDRSDFAHLADLLANIKGHFVLSINDTPHIRATFDDPAFYTAHVPTTYESRRTTRKTTELLISNWKGFRDDFPSLLDEKEQAA